MNTSFFILGLMTIGSVIYDTKARTMLEIANAEDSAEQTQRVNSDMDYPNALTSNDTFYDDGSARHTLTGNSDMDNINDLIANGTILNIPINFLNTESELKDQLAVEKRQFENYRTRNGDRNHWHCNTTVTWKDLGWLHYPRFVQEVACTRQSCMHGFYMCRSQYYRVRVLTVRNEDDDEEVTVPASLRSRWKFIEVAVSVACLCSM